MKFLKKKNKYSYYNMILAKSNRSLIQNETHIAPMVNKEIICGFYQL